MKPYRFKVWSLLLVLLLGPTCVASDATLTYSNGQVVQLKDITLHFSDDETSAIPATRTVCKSPSLKRFALNAEGFALHCGGRLYRIPASSVAAFGNLRPPAQVSNRSNYARFLIKGTSGFDQIEGEPVFRTRIKGVKRILGIESPVDFLFPDYGNWVSMKLIDGDTWKVEGDGGSYTLYNTAIETLPKTVPKQLGPHDSIKVSVFRGTIPNESFPSEYNVPLGNIRTIQFAAKQHSDIGRYIERLVTTAEDTRLAFLEVEAISGVTANGDTIWTRFITEDGDGFKAVVVKQIAFLWD